MRLTLPILALALVAAHAQAQTSQSTTPTPTPAPMTPAPATVTPTTPSASTPTTHATHTRRSMQERFDAANTTHDGHLTLDQAKAANMKRVVSHFDAMDKDKKGYVTVEDIHAYRSEHRGHAGRHTKSSTAS